MEGPFRIKTPSIFDGGMWIQCRFMSYNVLMLHLYCDRQRFMKALKLEAFSDLGRFRQIWKENQTGGWVKRKGKRLDIHVRLYEGMMVDCEVELTRREVLHHFRRAQPYYGPLLELLHRHRIGYKRVHPVPEDPKSVDVPLIRLKWDHVAFGSIAAFALVVLLA
jgi:hypothetical protein